MKLCKIALAAVSAVSANTAMGQVVINEVMQSNVYCIMDDLNDFPDSWVELYNNSDTAVSLEGYRLGLAKTYNTAYPLPTVTIAPRGYVLVYCDKAATGMHTDFRIDSGKGNVYLFDASGNVIENLSLKKQPAPDVAYGRAGDGDATWGYQLNPSPGEANTSGVSAEVLGDVTFSVAGGVWSSSRAISLKLSLPDNAPSGTRIIYTTDGSEPVKGKAKNYHTGITITSSTVIRAKAVNDACISVPSTAQSYIFMDREMQIPVLSIAINDEYLNDNVIGIFADGYGGNGNENYRHDWRRPINLEYFTAEGEASVLNQLCETRVQGGYTRTNPLKSMAFYANKRFGTKRFSYEFWAKDKPGVTDNKSFIARDGGNDYMWTYYRDGIMQRVIGRNTDIDWQGYTPAVVYINGKYHGMLAIRERSNEDNISANYDGLEDIDMFENWHEIKAGDWTAHDYFMEFIESAHTFEQWAEVINVESYVNLMALNFWVYNTDFPHNNTVFWRKRDGSDGRWRWLVKDTDFGLGIWNNRDNLSRNFIDFLNAPTNEDPTGYTLFRQLMKCDEFKDYFMRHLIVYMGDFLNASTFIEYINEIDAENHGEQQLSHETWKYQSGAWWSDLSYNLSFMRDWCNSRQNNMPSLMRKSFGLGTAVNVRVNQDLEADVAASLSLRYCDVALTRGVFNGKDYQGRTITIEGGPDDNIVAWQVKIGNKAVETIEGPVLTLQLTTVNEYAINAVIDNSGIADTRRDIDNVFVYADGQVSSADAVSVYDLSGRLIAGDVHTLTLPGRGCYIIVTADGRSRKVIY